MGHEDARVHGHEIATTHQLDDLVVAGAELKQLATRDHAVLHAGQEVLELRGVEADRFAALIRGRVGIRQWHGLDAATYTSSLPPGPAPTVDNLFARDPRPPGGWNSRARVTR